MFGGHCWPKLGRQEVAWLHSEGFLAGNSPSRQEYRWRGGLLLTGIGCDPARSLSEWRVICPELR
jgi:hypothetical protein